MNKPKVGDIYRWGWNKETLRELDYKREAGTLYHCCSRICVFQEDEKFWDTFWGGKGQHDKRFSIKDANQKLDLRYVANFSELEEAHPYARAYYKDSDCVDLSHSNSSRGNFYIRKNAKKSAEKIRRIVERNIKKLEGDAQYAQNRLNDMKRELDGLTEESCISIIRDVALTDSCYTDQL